MSPISHMKLYWSEFWIWYQGINQVQIQIMKWEFQQIKNESPKITITNITQVCLSSLTCKIWIRIFLSKITRAVIHWATASNKFLKCFLFPFIFQLDFSLTFRECFFFNHVFAIFAKKSFSSFCKFSLHFCS